MLDCICGMDAIHRVPNRICDAQGTRQADGSIRLIADRLLERARAGGEGIIATNRPSLSRLLGATHLIGFELADRLAESNLLSRDDQFV